MKNMRRGGVGLAALMATGLALAACGANDTSTSGDGPDVLASFYPLAFASEWVAGPDANVTNLTQPGVEAHDLELTARQVGRIVEADLIVDLRGFQPAVDDAIDQNAEGVALNVADVVKTLEGDAHEDHGHEDHGHDDLEGDPHVWLDPTNMAAIAEAVAERLATIAPARADGFRARADELMDELNALDEEYRSRLANCERRVVVTSHAAFGYLAHRYDLEFVGISGLDPDAEPSPARLAEVQQVVRDEGVTTIFHERLVSPAVAEALANDLGVETAVLDPIEGLTDDTADQDYLSLMRANLDALEEANGCT